MKITILFAIVLSLTFQVAHARKWKKVAIPGAKCGDGMPYKVFVDLKSKSKLALEFMGGGACWSTATCYGPNLRAWVHPLPRIPNFSTLTTGKSFLNNHSLVYFPYCTADVFAGRHVAKYGLGAKVHHKGFSNVEKALEYLSTTKKINFEKVDDVTLYGASAGAIASLIHSKTINPYLRTDIKKTILADSAGMHFGKEFWEKFSPEQIADFEHSFSALGFKPDFTDGFIAKNLKYTCEELADWNIGFLQGSQDVIMSAVFGNISPKKHEELIFSENGLASLNFSSLCSTWVKRTKMHTFLLTGKSADMSINGVSAYDFANKIYNGENNLRYVDSIKTPLRD